MFAYNWFAYPLHPCATIPILGERPSSIPSEIVKLNHSNAKNGILNMGWRPTENGFHGGGDKASTQIKFNNSPDQWNLVVVNPTGLMSFRMTPSSMLGISIVGVALGIHSSTSWHNTCELFILQAQFCHQWPTPLISSSTPYVLTSIVAARQWSSLGTFHYRRKWLVTGW